MREGATPGHCFIYKRLNLLLQIFQFKLILNIKFESFIVPNCQTVNLGVVFRTGAVWRRAAPLAVQLAHSRRVADDAALADAAVADD